MKNYNTIVLEATQKIVNLKAKPTSYKNNNYYFNNNLYDFLEKIKIPGPHCPVCVLIYNFFIYSINQ